MQHYFFSSMKTRVRRYWGWDRAAESYIHHHHLQHCLQKGSTLSTLDRIDLLLCVTPHSVDGLETKIDQLFPKISHVVCKQVTLHHRLFPISRPLLPEAITRLCEPRPAFDVNADTTVGSNDQGHCLSRECLYRICRNRVRNRRQINTLLTLTVGGLYCASERFYMSAPHSYRQVKAQHHTVVRRNTPG